MNAVRDALREQMGLGAFPSPLQQPLKPEEPAAPPSEWDQMSWWEKGLDLLGRTGYASAGAAHALVTGGNPIHGAWKGITGEERHSYSDVLGAMGMDEGAARATLGFGLDVALDPLTYVGFGEGKGAGKIVAGGVTKTLTGTGQAIRVASETDRAAWALRALNRLDAEDKIAFKGHFLDRYGVGSLAEMDNSLLSKLIGQRITGEGFAKFAQGEVPLSPMGRELIGKTPQQVFEYPTLRFAGVPLISSETMGKGIEALKGAYGAAEQAKGIGPVLQGARQGGQDVLKYLKSIFSTDTGDPVLNEIKTRYRDKLDFDSMRKIEETVGKEGYARKLAEMQGPERESANSMIRGYLESIGDVMQRQIPDLDKKAVVDSKISSMTDQLNSLHGQLKSVQEQHEKALRRSGAALESKSMEMIGATVAHEGGLEQAAAKEAKEQTLELHAAHELQFGDLKREMKARGIGQVAGISKDEYQANIPKQYRRKAGLGIDQWIDELKTRGTLGPNATEAEFYDLIKKAHTLPAPVSPESVKGGVTSPKTAARMAEVERELGELKKQRYGLAHKTPGVDIEKQIKALEHEHAQQVGLREEYAKNPPMKTVEERAQSKPPPGMPGEVAAEMRRRLDIAQQAESKKLPLGPEYRKGYFPHTMAQDIRPAVRRIIQQDAHKVLGKEFSGSLDAAQRRTYEGLVDDLTVKDLIENGKIDPDKLREVAGRQGVKLSAEDMHVFETDPIKAVLGRELKSIRALNHADMTREILASPHFVRAKVKLGNVQAIKETLAQNPGHSLFVPTKDYIDRFLTGSEREALRSGARPELRSTFLKDVSDILKNADKEIAGDPIRRLTDAYVLRNETAQHLSKTLSLQNQEQTTKNFLKLWDKGTGMWKMLQTLPNPGFHVRNAISYIWQAGILAGANNPQTWQRAMMALRNPEAGSNFGHFTAKEAIDLAERNGIVKGGFIGREIGETIEREVSPSRNPLSMSGPIARYGGKVVGSIDNWARFSLFADGLEKGMDVQSAINRTKKYLFDYNDLTAAEKTYAKRLIPFYTWTRKSIPLALETLVTQPGKVAALKKVQGEAEANVDGALDNKYVSDFIRDNLGVPIKKNADGSYSYFLMGKFIPTMDITKLDPKEIFGMLHPALKEPIEQMLNLNVYSGKPIERFPGELDKVVGVPMRSRLAHLARNVGILQQVDRLFAKNDFDAVNTPLSSLGFRTYDQDPARQLNSRVNDLQHEMGQMKSLIDQNREKYGDDSSITKQYVQRLANLTAERDEVKQNLSEVQAQAPQLQQGAARRAQAQRAAPSPAASLLRKIGKVAKPKRAFSPQIQKILGGGRRG